MVSRFDRTETKTTRARRLQREATPFERILWCRLSNGQVNGAAFRRQHPVGPYVLDFYCAAHKLSIELDGEQHAERRDADARRTAYINGKGISVLRFWNNEVRDNLEVVMETIYHRVVTRRKTRSPP